MARWPRGTDIRSTAFTTWHTGMGFDGGVRRTTRASHDPRVRCRGRMCGSILPGQAPCLRGTWCGGGDPFSCLAGRHDLLATPREWPGLAAVVRPRPSITDPAIAFGFGESLPACPGIRTQSHAGSDAHRAALRTADRSGYNSTPQTGRSRVPAAT